MTLTHQLCLCLAAVAYASLLPAVAADTGNGAAAPAAATSNDPQFGTIQVFNGRNLDGLHVFLEDPSADPAKTFRVEDGVLHVSGKPRGYARTLLPYADYKLHVEFRYPNGNANSGVLIHMVNRDEIWAKGFEVNLPTDHVGDVNVFWDARMNEESMGRTAKGMATGRLPRSTPQSQEKPLGEWNTLDIVADGDTITVTLNGVQVNHMTGVKPSAGTIGLQSEIGAVDFRNVTLTPLPPEVNLHTPMPPAK
jgi:hypothetical protein